MCSVTCAVPGSFSGLGEREEEEKAEGRREREKSNSQERERKREEKASFVRVIIRAKRFKLAQEVR